MTTKRYISIIPVVVILNADHCYNKSKYYTYELLARYILKCFSKLFVRVKRLTCTCISCTATTGMDGVRNVSAF